METSEHFFHKSWLYWVLRRSMFQRKEMSKAIYYYCKQTSCRFYFQVTYQPNSKKQEVNFYNYNHSHSDEPHSQDLSLVDILLFLFHKKAGKVYKLTIEDEYNDGIRSRDTMKRLEEGWNKPPTKYKQVIQRFYEFGYTADDCIKSDNQFRVFLQEHFSDSRVPLVFPGETLYEAPSFFKKQVWQAQREQDPRNMSYSDRMEYYYEKYKEAGIMGR